MAAVMATWRTSASHPLCVLRSKMDFVLTGRKSCAAGSNVPITDLEYADNTGVPFRTRADLVEHTPHVIAHFKIWGLQVHQGLGDRRSKSEVLFCAAPSHCFTDQATEIGPTRPNDKSITTSTRIKFSCYFSTLLLPQPLSYFVTPATICGS